MSFDVFGDEITFDGQTVAKFIKPRWPSLKIDACVALSEWKDPDEAYEQGYTAGYDDAHNAIQMLEEECEALRQQLHDLEFGA